MFTDTSYTNGENCVSWYVYSRYESSFLTYLQTIDETDKLIGVVISKLEPHRSGPMRGYIAMLAVRNEHRGKGIGNIPFPFGPRISF